GMTISCSGNRSFSIKRPCLQPRARSSLWGFGTWTASTGFWSSARSQRRKKIEAGTNPIKIKFVWLANEKVAVELFREFVENEILLPIWTVGDKEFLA